MSQPEDRSDELDVRVNAHAGRFLRAKVAEIEATQQLDAVGSRLGGLGERLVSRPGRRRLLRGEWLGHALHPLLTDFPLGAWMSATLLDLFGGEDSQKAASLLNAFGLAAALPTIAAGLAELASAGATTRRVAAAHASLNGSAFLLYGASLGARLTGKPRGAAVLGVTGGMVATVGGYFGGHLSLVHGAGVEGRSSSAPGA